MFSPLRFSSIFRKRSSAEISTLIFLAIIIGVGAFLRFHGLPDLFRFNADQARDAAVVDQMLSEKEFPFLGPKAGGTSFKLGPAFYYLQYFSALVFGHDPAGMAFFVPLLGVFSILLFFFFLRLCFSRPLSLSLTFFYAISFFSVKYSRFAWNPNVIPFFLLLFLIASLKLLSRKDSRPSIWHLTLAGALGIGVQLHATLLLLFPAALLFVMFIQLFQKKNFSFLGMGTVILIALTLNLPMIFHDFKHQGENIRSFLAGADKKTERGSSFGKNFLQTGRFFVESGTYVLSGKNWQFIRKPELANGPLQSSALPIASLLFLGGVLVLCWRTSREASEEKKDFLKMVAFFTAASFLLFWPLASELNDRFFIVLFFFPFVLLGLLIQPIFSHPLRKQTFLSIPFIVALLTFFVWNNFQTFHETFISKAFAAGNRDYGGISLKEARDLASAIEIIAADNLSSGKPIFLADFEFSPSISYFLEKSHLDIPAFSGKKVSERALVLSVTEENNLDDFLEKRAAFYSVANQNKTGQFVLVALHPVTHRIGFITDIHATRSKKNAYDVKPDLKLPIIRFTKEMNEVFHPILSVQGGDLIEGTRREGEKSIEDFKLADQYLQDLAAPVFHVLGNHETRGLTRKEWLELTRYEKSYYSIDYEKLRLIVLDGNESDTGEDENDDDAPAAGIPPYSLTEEQLAWLEKTLKEKENIPKVVFIHYPLTQPKAGKALDLLQTEKMKRLFSENGVLAVFSGHTEILSYDQIDGVRYFVIPGLERSKNKHVLWLDCFAEITVGEKTWVRFFYKKDRAEEEYQTLEIPSDEFDRMER